MNNVITPGSLHNAKRLLWAGFFSIFAAGVGFSVRTGILGYWAADYGFTKAELGEISGGGLAGFGIVIILGSLIADKIGYGRLMFLAVLMHLLSAGLQLCTDPIYIAFGRDGVYWSLFIAMFLFSIANGVCEAVVNPMVATLFPAQKTHYLNILHAGWPGGLIAGGVLSYLLNGGAIGDFVLFPNKVHWIVQMSMFLVPVLIYGLMLLGQTFPKSEAGEAGVGFGTMLAEFASPILLLLLFIHALVGFVELGTDSWIPRITGSIVDNQSLGMLLFIYTSGLMFILRFFAGPIEHRLSPLGLLCLSGILGCVGLTMVGNAQGILMCVLAVTVYAVGKTFLWPTMLAVVSERFPKGGALTIGAVGGVGTLSAGFLGVPGIGFMQDYNATTDLRKLSQPAYHRYVAEQPKHFLGIFETKGLDGSKTSILEMATDVANLTKEAGKLSGKEAVAKLADAKETERQLRRTLELSKLEGWWQASQSYAPSDVKPVQDAGDFGGRMAMIWTAAVPAAMAILYLLLILYFRLQGGYKRLEISAASVQNGSPQDIQWKG